MANTKKSTKKVGTKKTVCKCEGCKNCKKEGCKCGCCGNDSVKYTNIFFAWRAFWRRGFTEWRGTSSRSEYCLSWLANVIVWLVLVGLFWGMLLVDAMLFKDLAIFSTIVLSVLLVYMLASIVPVVSMLTRRLHDAGLSAWFLLIYLVTFIPVIGSWLWFAFLVTLACLPTIVDNPYHKFNK